MPIHNQYSQDYDKILKENVEAMILPLAQKVLGLEIEGFEPILDNLQRTSTNPIIALITAKFRHFCG